MHINKLTLCTSGFKSLLLGRNSINIKRTQLVVEQGDVHMPSTWVAEGGQRAAAPGGPRLLLTGVQYIDNYQTYLPTAAFSEYRERGAQF